MKVSKLEGPALDYWVARAEGLPLSIDFDQGEYILIGKGDGDLEQYSPCSDWSIAGPIIEREQIGISWLNLFPQPGFEWHANVATERESFNEDGPTPLIAAMRAFVASKFGEEVDAICTTRAAVIS